MTRHTASGRAGLRARARRRLTLTLPIALIALVVAAFALAPTRISHRANDRTDERLSAAVSRAFVPAPAIHVPVALAGPVVPGGGRALSRPRRPVGRWRVER
jgi:hypothetical protein